MNRKAIGKKEELKEPTENAKHEKRKDVDEAIGSDPQRTRFHMPKAPTANATDIQRFKHEMIDLFCSFEAHGSISDAVVSRFKQEINVGQPPTIQNIINDISENTSYKDEKVRFMKARKLGASHFSLNVSQSFSGQAANQLKNFSLMNDIGDIVLQYGKTTGFRCIIPNDCVKSSYNELKVLFEKQLPRCAFGITISLQNI